MGNESSPPERARVVRMHFSVDTWARGAVLVALTLALISVILELTNAFDSDTFLSRALRLFDLNLDDSFNGWYSSMLAAGAAIGAIAASARSERARIRRGFRLLAGMLLYLSLDEVTGLHTRFFAVIRRLVTPSPGWLVVILMVLLVVGLLLFAFLVGLPAPARSGLIVGGVAFVGSAVFVDYLSKRMGYGTAGTLTSVLEELGEMIGVIIIGRTCFLTAASGGDITMRDLLGLRSSR
jgi:hypothetical protein